MYLQCKNNIWLDYLYMTITPLWVSDTSDIQTLYIHQFINKPKVWFFISKQNKKSVDLLDIYYMLEDLELHYMSSNSHSFWEWRD